MKPNDLKPPFSKQEPRRVIIQDRIWYVPDRKNAEESFAFPGWDHPDLFGNSNPVCVEYCSGNGEWIAQKAKEHPAINWLAVEIRFSRTRQIWSKIKNRHLDNLIVLCGEGMYATANYFPAATVQHVYVNFPDPWPKRRHAKNRLIQTDFIKQINRILINDGKLTLVTDDADYSEQMIHVITENPHFRSLYPAPYYITDTQDYGVSWFEVLWREKGRVIRFHQFSKNSTPSVVSVTLDGQMRSDLGWESQLKVADSRIAQGAKILWNIELGLFDRLPFTLLNKSQWMTLSLAIDHFIERVWPKYVETSQGLCLYQGSLDFSEAFLWDEALVNSFRAWVKEVYETLETFNHLTKHAFATWEEIDAVSMAGSEAIQLYAANLCIDYLDTLAARVPEKLPCFVNVDASAITSPLLQASIQSAERAQHFRWITKGGPLPLQERTDKKTKLGICLPEATTLRDFSTHKLNLCLELLIKHNISFRVIAEELLTTEWDGLDAIIVNSAAVSPWGLRKLQGFCAAGGNVISIGSPLGVAEEISFENWLHLLHL